MFVYVLVYYLHIHMEPFTKDVIHRGFSKSDAEWRGFGKKKGVIRIIDFSGENSRKLSTFVF